MTVIGGLFIVFCVLLILIFVLAGRSNIDDPESYQGINKDLPTTYARLSDHPSLPVALWTPSQVAITSFLFGFLGGVVMAYINRIKMGMKGESAWYIVLGCVGLLIIAIPSDQSPAFYVGVNAMLTIVLHHQSKEDIDAFLLKAPSHRKASTLQALLIGLGMFSLGVAILPVISYVLAIIFSDRPHLFLLFLIIGFMGVIKHLSGKHD